MPSYSSIVTGDNCAESGLARWFGPWSVWGVTDLRGPLREVKSRQIDVYCDPKFMTLCVRKQLPLVFGLICPLLDTRSIIRDKKINFAIYTNYTRPRCQTTKFLPQDPKSPFTINQINRYLQSS